MGIQMVLTLAVALVILAAAFVLRGIVLGLFRLGSLAYRNTRQSAGRHAAPRLDQALPRITLRERAAGLGRAITAVVQYVAAGAAPIARRLRDELRTAAAATTRVVGRESSRFYRRLSAESAHFYSWLRIETERAYSGSRGRTTFQAIGESPTTWGGRPHAVLMRR